MTYNDLAKKHGQNHFEYEQILGDSQVVKEALSKIMSTSTKSSLFNTFQALVFPVTLMGITLSRIDTSVFFKMLTVVLIIAHVMVITHQNFAPTSDIR